MKVKKIEKGLGTSTINLNSGKLILQDINTTIENNGANIAPGQSPGTLNIAGDLNLNAGTLEMEVAKVTDNKLVYDSCNVTGKITFGGELKLIKWSNSYPFNFSISNEF